MLFGLREAGLRYHQGARGDEQAFARPPMAVAFSFSRDCAQALVQAPNAPSRSALAAGRNGSRRWEMSIWKDARYEEVSGSRTCLLSEAFQPFIQILHANPHPFCGLSSTELNVDLSRLQASMTSILGNGVNIHACSRQVR